MFKEKKMKKLIFSLCVMILAAGTWIFAQDALIGQKVSGFPFNVYTDALDKQNHFIPAGWMGDTGDIKYSDKWATNPKSGKTCIQIKYSADKKQGAGWAGIYWQNPANNWGNSKGGFNLSGATTLSFWARGDKGGEQAEFKIGGIAGDYPDSMTATTGPVELTKEWKQFSIDISKEDMLYINGGFCVVLTADANSTGAVILIDDIIYAGKPAKAAPESVKTK
jgi:hypothetical protein